MEVSISFRTALGFSLERDQHSGKFSLEHTEGNLFFPASQRKEERECGLDQAKTFQS